MPDLVLKLIDILLFVTHILVISINMFGWIVKKTRRIHLVTILLTAFSWFFVGIWCGWGYCFLTDWEWEIKRQLGEQDLPNSFIHYLVNDIFSLNMSANLLDTITVLIFIMAFLLSIILNFSDRRLAKNEIR
ncbi:MAG: DUF2784 domain-containing protein [Saprospiraceae bacterium]|nr:DUF2784 domain-containing protein [Saprospiraceae bacterium]